MTSRPPEYYRARAAEERAAASGAPTPAVARTHEDLARMYDQQARQAERIVEPELDFAD